MARTLTPLTYLAICGVLITLTGLTVGASFVELPGRWHILLGLSIAAVKGTLVVLFFMHLLWSTRLVWIVAVVSVFWLGMLAVLTMSDFTTRGLVPFMPGH